MKTVEAEFCQDHDCNIRRGGKNCALKPTMIRFCRKERSNKGYKMERKVEEKSQMYPDKSFV